jgi:Nickel responsive protein SCO4226-like
MHSCAAGRHCRKQASGLHSSLTGRRLVAETDRRLFLVEHDLSGLTAPQLDSVHRALGEAVRRENLRGRRIRYVQRIYAPVEQRCLCLFEASGPDLVRSVNDIAQFPLARVLAVLSCEPDEAAALVGLGPGGDNAAGDP